MTRAEIQLARALLTRDWRAGRMSRCQALAGGAMAREDVEEAEYLYQLAELDVQEAQLTVDEEKPS